MYFNSTIQLQSYILVYINAFVFSFPEAGLFLFSLYVSEMWGGATSAKMFLSHVNLVATTKCKIKKTSQPAVTQIAIKAVCDDIITSTS